MWWGTPGKGSRKQLSKAFVFRPHFLQGVFFVSLRVFHTACGILLRAALHTEVTSPNFQDARLVKSAPLAPMSFHLDGHNDNFTLQCAQKIIHEKPQKRKNLDHKRRTTKNNKRHERTKTNIMYCLMLIGSSLALQQAPPSTLHRSMTVGESCSIVRRSCPGRGETVLHSPTRRHWRTS